MFHIVIVLAKQYVYTLSPSLISPRMLSSAFYIISEITLLTVKCMSFSLIEVFLYNIVKGML